MNKERPYLKAVKGEGNPVDTTDLEALGLLTHGSCWQAYRATEEERKYARWRIVGKDVHGDWGTHYYLIPKQGDEFTARRIVQIMNNLGAQVKFERNV